MSDVQTKPPNLTDLAESLHSLAELLYTHTTNRAKLYAIYNGTEQVEVVMTPLSRGGQSFPVNPELLSRELMEQIVEPLILHEQDKALELWDKVINVAALAAEQIKCVRQKMVQPQPPPEPLPHVSED